MRQWRRLIQVNLFAAHASRIDRRQLFPDVSHGARKIFARSERSIVIVDDDPALIIHPLQLARQMLEIDLAVSQIAVGEHERSVLASWLLHFSVGQAHLLS